MNTANESSPFLQRLVRGYQHDNIPAFEPCLAIEDAHDSALPLTPLCIGKMLGAVNDKAGLQLSYSGSVPHSPVWLHFQGSFGEHTDGAGGCLFYVAAGHGVFMHRDHHRWRQMTVRTGDIVLFNDLFPHKYTAKSPSLLCSIFSVFEAEI